MLKMMDGSLTSLPLEVKKEKTAMAAIKNQEVIILNSKETFIPKNKSGKLVGVEPKSCHPYLIDAEFISTSTNPKEAFTITWRTLKPVLW